MNLRILLLYTSGRVYIEDLDHSERSYYMDRLGSGICPFLFSIETLNELHQYPSISQEHKRFESLEQARKEISRCILKRQNISILEEKIKEFE